MSTIVSDSVPFEQPTLDDLHGDAANPASALPDDVAAEMAQAMRWNVPPTSKEFDQMWAEEMARRDADQAA